jgi:hypothetical protein
MVDMTRIGLRAILENPRPFDAIRRVRSVGLLVFYTDLALDRFR